MNQHAPASPLLDHCPDSLPSEWYFDGGHYTREMKAIWSRHWIYAGRLADFPLLTMRRISVAEQNLILVRDENGVISCFHNVCPHRGSELCSVAETQLKSKLITCPYHAWSFDLAGHLRRRPFVIETPDFDAESHGLYKVHVAIWNGLIFVCLAVEPPPFADAPDLGMEALAHWPIADLVTGHRLVKELNCNWKVFWENYNECLHCPGIHPELCDMVPVYGKGFMANSEMPGWSAASGQDQHLKPGARSWTMSGKACGVEFPDLTAEERLRGHTFVALQPTCFVVAHVDYVRIVSLRPLGPERTELTAEWLFPETNMNAAGFDLAEVTDFATMVMMQDAGACELNQRGLRSPAFRHGRLMPQEFDVHRFQNWVRNALA